MKKIKISTVLATRNEESNIRDCLDSVKEFSDEIIVVDESSEDKTREIAQKIGAKVYKIEHNDNFHITKQFAIDKAKGEWILQMDADERIGKELAKEIVSVVEGKHDEFVLRLPQDKLEKKKLFEKHSNILKKTGRYGSATGEVVAYLIPRLNYFLGKPLRHAGVYPDPAIRLIKNGKARLPMKSVHEIMEVDGKIDWLYSDMEHHDSPTLERYLSRLNRYTDLQSEDFQEQKISLNWGLLIYYSSIKPCINFMRLYFRHSGYKDGMRGFVWSVFSSLHFPIAYFKYWSKNKK